MNFKFVREGLSKSQEKNYEYNQRQTETGHALKTLNGSTISRCRRFGVGKEIGGSIYAHKNYMSACVPREVIDTALSIAQREYPNFSWNCFRYNLLTNDIALQEAPGFDSEREPVVGKQLFIGSNGSVRIKEYKQIWHHKWLWVQNDYNGFNVRDSWEWSKKWLLELPVPANGNSEEGWEKQLQKYGIEE